MADQHEERRVQDVGDLYERLDAIGDLDALAAGGTGGLGAGFDLVADVSFRGPDDLFDSLDATNDFGDSLGTDDLNLDDLF